MSLIRFTLPMLIFSSVTLSSCGGGGGGGGGNSGGSNSGGSGLTSGTTISQSAAQQDIAYTGLNSSAPLTAGNFRDFSNLVLGFPSDDGAYGLSKTSDGSIENKSQPVGILGQFQLSLSALMNEVEKSDQQLKTLSTINQNVDINTSEPCDSGSISLQGTLRDSGLGALNISFNNCELEGITVNGSGDITITNFDTSVSEVLSGRIFYSGVRITADGVDNLVTGDFQFNDLSANSQVTLNMVVVDQIEDSTYRLQDFTYSMVEDLGGIVVSFEGLIFHPNHGYASTSSIEDILFSINFDIAQTGVLTLTGFGQSNGQIEIFGSSVFLSLDEDGDGNFELGVQTNWDALASQSSENGIPEANIDVLGEFQLSEPVQLSGTNSSDPDADLLTYTWEILDQPSANAGIIESVDLPEINFTASETGIYTIGLSVSDGTNSSPVRQITLAQLETMALSHNVVDAQYSSALDSALMVSSYPDNRLYMMDMSDYSESSIALNKIPTSISISPNGEHAAIGHDALITIVDLNTLDSASPTIDLLDVSTDVFDIVLDGNGFVHAFPAADQWVNIHSVEIAANIETLSTGSSVREGTKARLHPNGSVIYGADNGLSPSDIEKYDISSGTANYLYDSPYHGTYDMCGDLWFWEDGSDILTACGNVFRSSSEQASDMVYRGSLDLGTLDGSPYYISHASHSEEEGELLLSKFDWWSCADHTADQCISYVDGYDDDFFAQHFSFELDPITVSGLSYAQVPEHIFHGVSNGKRFVISRLDQIPTESNEYYISTF